MLLLLLLLLLLSALKCASCSYATPLTVTAALPVVLHSRPSNAASPSGRLLSKPCKQVC